MVRINDRCPFVRGRIIDVTPAAAQALRFSGVARVSLEVVMQDVRRFKSEVQQGSIDGMAE